MKRLGGSFDWDRVAYTMNEVCPLHGMDLRVWLISHIATVESRDGEFLQLA